MTLYKQLIILIIALFIILFLSVFYTSSNNLREFTNTQLASHAHDAATSLGIAISSELAEKDLASIETHVNAMFDSGYYQKIEILNVEDKVFFIKHRELTEMENIPGWLISIFPLNSPEKEAIVMDGWSPAGTVKVISFPEFGYQNLWNNVKSIFNLFALIILILFLLSSFAIRALLKPLTEIEQQASAISKRIFSTINIKPKTIEFKRVVEVMNKMSSKLKTIFAEQAALTEELKVQAFQDEVTGLSNRTVFMKQLKFFTQSDEYQYQGCLLIMQIHDLIEINKKYGHLKGNQLLIAVGQMLQGLSEQYPQSFVARISGTEFAIIIQSISPDQLNQLGEAIQSMLKDIAIEMDCDSTDIAHSGITLTYPEQTMVGMLSEADIALRLAQQKGMNAYHIYEEHKEGMTVYGAAQWSDIIMDSMAQNLFELHFQPVIDGQSVEQQKEAMIRLHYKERLISAGIFIPMAEYLGITHHLDKWVIRRVIARVQSTDKDSTGKDSSNKHDEIIYSINLSQDSLREPDFPSWLKKQLGLLTEKQQTQIIFETSEYHVKKYYSEYKNLLNYLESCYCQYCIDHFGVGFTHMNYLNDVKVDFIKIHGSYAHDIQDTPEVSSYIRQVVTMAHSLDIKVIAEGIEGESELEILKSLKVDLFQGFHIGRPELVFQV